MLQDVQKRKSFFVPVSCVFNCSSNVLYAHFFQSILVNMEGSKIPHELKNLEFCFVKKTTSFSVKCLNWAKSQSVQVFGFGGLNMNQFVSFEVPTQLLSEAAFF